MKKLLSLLAIVTLFVAGFTSCGEDDATYTPAVSSIQIKTADVKFDPQASTGKIVYSANAKVTFSTEASWITLSQSEANAINVEVTDNTELIGRTGVVVLTDGTGKVNVIVQQKGLAFGFYDGEYKEIPAAGATYSIEGQTSFEIDFKDCPDWVHFNKTATGYDIVVDATPSSNDRKAIVTLDGNGMTAKFLFEQKGSFNFKSADYNIPNTGDSSIIIKGIITEDIQIAVTGGDGWLEIDTLKNGYNLLVPANPDPATRVAEISISCTDYSASYKVSQVGVYMNVYSAENVAIDTMLLASDAAETYEFKVESNAEFKLTCDEWFTAKIEEGKLIVTAQENTTGAVRRGKLTYSLGDIFENSIDVLQYDAVKDLNGYGIVLFYDEEEEDYFYFDVNLSDKGIEFPDFLSYAGDGVVWTLPLKKDTEKGTVSIANGDYIGNFNNTNDLYSLIPTAQGQLTLAENITTATPEFDTYEDALVANLGDAIVFGAFAPGGGFVVSGFEDILLEIIEPVLIVYGEEEETDNAAFKRCPTAKKLSAPMRNYGKAVSF